MVLYDIVIAGLAPNTSRAEAVAELVRSLNLGRSHIAPLLDRGRTTFKRGVDEGDAERYLDALRAAGVRAIATPHETPCSSHAACSRAVPIEDGRGSNEATAVDAPLPSAPPPVAATPVPITFSPVTGRTLHSGVPPPAPDSAPRPLSGAGLPPVTGRTLHSGAPPPAPDSAPRPPPGVGLPPVTGRTLHSGAPPPAPDSAPRPPPPLDSPSPLAESSIPPALTPPSMRTLPGAPAPPSGRSSEVSKEGGLEVQPSPPAEEVRTLPSATSLAAAAERSRAGAGESRSPSAAQRLVSLGSPTIEALRTRIRTAISRSERTPAPVSPRLVHCRVVIDVAPVSPASELGLRPGDLIVAIDGVPAAQCTIQSGWDVPARAWEFFLKAPREFVGVETNGAPLGIRCGPTVAAARIGSPVSPLDLLSLWERGEHEVLRDRCRDVVGPGPRRLGEDHLEHDRPEYVLLGAALIELGDRHAGLAIVRDYLQHFARHFAREFTGLALYYVALAHLDQDRGRAIQASLRAHIYYRCQATCDLAERLTGAPPPPWVGRHFPIDYELLTLHASQPVTLARALADLDDHQLLMVCLLAEAPAGGSYETFLANHARYVTTLRETFQLHVVAPDMTTQQRDRLQRESAAAARGAPFILLHDAEHTVASALGVDFGMNVLAVDKRGVIRGDDVQGEVALWNALFELASTTH